MDELDRDELEGSFWQARKKLRQCRLIYNIPAQIMSHLYSRTQWKLCIIIIIIYINNKQSWYGSTRLFINPYNLRRLLHPLDSGWRCGWAAGKAQSKKKEKGPVWAGGASGSIQKEGSRRRVELLAAAARQKKKKKTGNIKLPRRRVALQYTII